METKTIEQIKYEVAKNSIQGFEDWEHFILCINTYPEYSHLLDEFIKEVAEQYAYQKCEEQKQNSIDRIPSYNQGRSGCTYGDTEYDSESVVFGYNMALDHCKENISKSYNVCNSKNK